MTSQDMLNASLLHFKAVKARAEVNLDIYLTAVVGVGEHADLVKEIIELTKTIVEAEEAIKFLEKKL